jgi:hypothetical protein
MTHQTKTMIIAINLFEPPFLRIVVYIALLLLLLLGRWVVRGICVKRWIILVDIVKRYAPDWFVLMGEPKYFLWQKLLRGDLMTNDRFWFLAIWRPDTFPGDSRIRTALNSYRKAIIFGWSYTFVLLVVTGLLWMVRGVFFGI